MKVEELNCLMFQKAVNEKTVHHTIRLETGCLEVLVVPISKKKFPYNFNNQVESE